MHRATALASLILCLSAAACFGKGTPPVGNGFDGGLQLDGAPAFDAGRLDSSAPAVDAASHDASADAPADAGAEGEAGPAPAAKLAIGTSGGSTTADFGTVEVGTSSAATSFVVSNSGTASTSTLTATLAGTDAASFAVDTDGCTGTTLAPAKTCTITVHFHPATAGLLQASLGVAASQGGQVSIPLQGQGATPGALSIAPASKDFGSVSTGASSTAQTFTLTNTGQSSTGAIATSVTGTAASAFVLSADTCNGTSLSGGGTCTVDVTFTPATAGALSASLAVTAGTSTATASLSGTALGPPTFTIAPSPYAFASTVEGTSSGPQSFTLTNTGGDPSAVPQFALSGPNAADFTPAAGSCTAALAGGAQCSFTVTFHPTTSAAESATLSVTGASATATDALTGAGLVPPTLTVTPGPGFSGDFGDVGLGAAPATGTLTVTNGGQAATGGDVSLASANPAFTIPSTTCTTLGPGASCTAVVSFTPGGLGAASSLVTASASASASGTYTVKGTGAQPTLAISPPAAWTGFGTVEAGSSASATFTITNSGPVATNVAPTVKSSNPDFSVATSCPSALAINGTCTALVTFAPQTTVNDDSSTLTASVTPGTPGTYTVTGSATVPVLQITAQTTSAFGFVTEGQPATLEFTVKNVGLFASGTPSFTSSNADFTTAAAPSASCTTTASLGPSATCNIDVVFKPSSSASPESSVITATPSPGTAGTVSVSGQGGVGALSGLSAWTSAAVAQGSSNHITYTITNGGHGTTDPLQVTGVTATSVFVLQTNTCENATLGPAATCTIIVVFTPTTSNTTPATTASATVTVTDTASDTISAGLSGLVLSATPYLVFSPSPGNWGTLTPGEPDVPLALTGTNYSTQAAVVGSVTFLNTGGYRIAQSAGCAGTTVAAYDTVNGVASTCPQPIELTAAGPTTSLPANAGIQAMSAAGAPMGPVDTLEASW